MKTCFIIILLLFIKLNSLAQTGQESNAQKNQIQNTTSAPTINTPPPGALNQRPAIVLSNKDSTTIKNNLNTITSTINKERELRDSLNQVKKFSDESIEKSKKDIKIYKDQINVLDSELASLKVNKAANDKIIKEKESQIADFKSKLLDANKQADAFAAIAEKAIKQIEDKEKDIKSKSALFASFKSLVLIELKNRLLNTFGKDTVFSDTVKKYKNELNIAKNFYKNLNKDNIDNRVDLLWLRDSSFLSIYLKVIDNLQRLDSVESTVTKIKSKTTLLKVFKVDTTNLFSTKDYDILTLYSKDLESIHLELIKKYDDFGNSYKVLYKEIKTFNQLFDKTKKSSEDIDAIPNLTSILGQNFIAPTINLRGSTKFGTKNISGDIRLFTSAISNSQNRISSIYVPEASIYGITVNLSYGIAFPEINRVKIYALSEKKDVTEKADRITSEIASLKKKADSLSILKLGTRDDSLGNRIKIVGINQEIRMLRGDRRVIRRGKVLDYTPESRFPMFIYFNANYLGKSLMGVVKDSLNNKNDTTNFTSDIIHAKIGTQFILFKNILSLYFNYNMLNGIVNRAPLNTFQPSLVNGFTSYVDSGIKFFLPLGKVNPVNLYWDFDLIIINKPISEILKSNDSVIPNIKVGLLKSF